MPFLLIFEVFEGSFEEELINRFNIFVVDASTLDASTQRKLGQTDARWLPGGHFCSEKLRFLPVF